MSTKLKAGTATSGAVIDADATGILELQSGSTPTTAITVNTSQNVGIGTASPAAKLDVSGGRAWFTANSEGYNIYLRYNSSSNGCFIGSPAADSFAVYNAGGSERMRVDASGYLTTPYQPFFFGRLAAGATKAASWNLLSNNYTDVVLNRGSCYNTSTGNFTCPVTGDYQVSVGGFIATAGDGARWAIMVRKNGSDYQMLGSQLADGDSPAPYNTLIVPCSAGDTLNALYMYSPGAISFSSGIYGWGLQVRLIG